MVNRPELHVIRDLNQIKALADPLRQQILAGFVSQARTTKQLADLLGVPPTRLYRHVDYLQRVGLIELVETRQKRGTTEKYFQAIAHRFSVAADSLGSEGNSVIEQSLDRAFADIQAAIRRGSLFPDAIPDTVLALGSLRLAPEDLPFLQQRILELVKDLPSNHEDRKLYGYLVAIYPSKTEP